LKTGITGALDIFQMTKITAVSLFGKGNSGTEFRNWGILGFRDSRHEELRHLKEG
jgi:hypothetical protein